MLLLLAVPRLLFGGPLSRSSASVLALPSGIGQQVLYLLGLFAPLEAWRDRRAVAAVVAALVFAALHVPLNLGPNDGDGPAALANAVLYQASVGNRSRASRSPATARPAPNRRGACARDRVRGRLGLRAAPPAPSGWVGRRRSFGCGQMANRCSYVKRRSPGDLVGSLREWLVLAHPAEDLVADPSAQGADGLASWCRRPRVRLPR